MVAKTSSSRDAYGVQNKIESDKVKKDPFARFKDAQDTNPMILNYNERLPHLDNTLREDSSDVDLRMTTTARAMNVCLCLKLLFYCNHCLLSTYS